MSEFVLVGLAAALYVLGAYQGSTIADVIDETAAKEDMEITPGSRFFLTWCWPLATLRAMRETAND